MSKFLLAALLSAMAILGRGGCDGEEGNGDGTERRYANCAEDGRAIFQVTPAQGDRVSEIIRRDPILREVLGSSSYRLESVGAWTNTGATKLEGGAAVVRVDPPVTIESVRVPITVDPPAGVPDPDPCLRYLERSAVVSAEGVRRLMLLVDLSESRVVELNPTGAQVSYSEESGPEPSDAYDVPAGY